MGFIKSVKYNILSDEKLIVHIKNGSESAFDELYQRYSKRMLFYFVQKLNGDKVIAQDFLQDLFLKVLEKLELYDSQRSFKAWIYTMANNMCKNHYRKNAIREVGLNYENHALLVLPVGFDGEKENEVFLNRLNHALRTIDEKHREVFVLRYRENLSIHEISEFLRCPKGTVKSRLFTVVKRLSLMLKNQSR